MIKTIILFIVFVVLLVIPFTFSLANIAKRSDEAREAMFREYIRKKKELNEVDYGEKKE